MLSGVAGLRGVFASVAVMQADLRGSTLRFIMISDIPGGILVKHSLKEGGLEGFLPYFTMLHAVVN